jgi:hypothetical protein
MGATGCPKMLVTNYQSMLYNIPEKQDLIYISKDTWNQF